MTISQQPTGRLPAWRALRRSARTLRNLHEEQVYAWECFFRPAGAPRHRPQAPAPAGDSRAAAGLPYPGPSRVADN